MVTTLLKLVCRKLSQMLLVILLIGFTFCKQQNNNTFQTCSLFFASKFSHSNYSLAYRDVCNEIAGVKRSAFSSVSDWSLLTTHLTGIGRNSITSWLVPVAILHSNTVLQLEWLQFKSAVKCSKLFRVTFGKLHKFTMTTHCNKKTRKACNRGYWSEWILNGTSAQ